MDNPYEGPPSAADHGQAPTATTRWRWLPAVPAILLSTLGGLFFLLGSWGCCTLASKLFKTREILLDRDVLEYTAPFVGVAVATLLGGASWLAAGRCSWQQKWTSSIVLAIVGLALLSIAFSIDLIEWD